MQLKIQKKFTSTDFFFISNDANDLILVVAHIMYRYLFQAFLYTTLAYCGGIFPSSKYEQIKVNIN